MIRSMDYYERAVSRQALACQVRRPSRPCVCAAPEGGHVTLASWERHDDLAVESAATPPCRTRRATFGLAAVLRTGCTTALPSLCSGPAPAPSPSTPRRPFAPNFVEGVPSSTPPRGWSGRRRTSAFCGCPGGDLEP
jgi:hypothetical protein